MKTLSIRWRILLPLIGVALALTLLSVFILQDWYQKQDQSQFLNQLQLRTDHFWLEMDAQLQVLQNEALRIRNTQGISDAILIQTDASLASTLESLAQLAHLNLIILLDENGREVIGILQEESGFGISSGAMLANAEDLSRWNNNQASVKLLQTSQAYILSLSLPIQLEGRVLGAVMVGRFLKDIMNESLTSDEELVFYNSMGDFIVTSIHLTDEIRLKLNLSSQLVDQILTLDTLILTPISSNLTPISPNLSTFSPILMPIQEINSRQMQGIIYPFILENKNLGFVQFLIPNNQIESYLDSSAWLAFSLAILIFVIFLTLFFFLTRLSTRLNRLKSSIPALIADGEKSSFFTPGDEIQQLDHSLQEFSKTMHNRNEFLQSLANSEKNKREQLLAILENLPDIIIVKNTLGRIIFMNQLANRTLTATDLHQIPDFSDQPLGLALTQDLYQLPQTHFIHLSSGQYAARAMVLTSLNQESLGVVISLRLEEAQMRPFTWESRISHEPQQIHLLVTQIRQLIYATLDSKVKVLRLDAIIWALHNEWKQIALLKKLDFQIQSGLRNIYIQADEYTLRAAISYIIENAITYSQAEQKITLILIINKGFASLFLRDQAGTINLDSIPLKLRQNWPKNQSISQRLMPQLPETYQLLLQNNTQLILNKDAKGMEFEIRFPMVEKHIYELPEVNEDDLRGDTIDIDQ